MTKKILIAGFACWSVLAVAQASGSKDQAASAAQKEDQHPKEVASGKATGGKAVPRDISTGQSSGKAASQPAGEQVQAPRDLATGQATGKRQYAPVIIRKVSDDESMSAREQQSPKATGKSAQDDWQAPAAKTSAPANSNGQTRVAPSDVNGDGKADAARVAKGDVNGDGKADAAINNSHSNIKNSKDAATGQASGKRQHSDITITKHSDATPQQ